VQDGGTLLRCTAVAPQANGLQFNDDHAVRPVRTVGTAGNAPADQRSPGAHHRGEATRKAMNGHQHNFQVDGTRHSPRYVPFLYLQPGQKMLSRSCKLIRARGFGADAAAR